MQGAGRQQEVRQPPRDTVTARPALPFALRLTSVRAVAAVGPRALLGPPPPPLPPIPMIGRRLRGAIARAAAMQGPRPVVLSGPSGAGKSTLLKKLLKDYENVFGFSVSHTTRQPRPGEVNGKDYHFVTREEMQKEIDAGEFIEHAEFSGNMYGTRQECPSQASFRRACGYRNWWISEGGGSSYWFCSVLKIALIKGAVQAVQAQNQICVLDIDIQGVRNIKKTDLNPIYISVQPPSLDILEKRLRDRKTETEESLMKRLTAARIDLELSKEPGLFDLVIINDDLEKAYSELKETLLEEIKKTQESRKS